MLCPVSVVERTHKGKRNWLLLSFDLVAHIQSGLLGDRLAISQHSSICSTARCLCYSFVAVFMDDSLRMSRSAKLENT